MAEIDDTVTDEELARRIQEKDEDALVALINRYEGKLLRYGRRILPYENDIEDIIQDVFISMYENINDFDTTRRFSPWIYRIAHNALVSIARSRSHTLSLPDLDLLLPHLIYEDTIDSMKEQEATRVLMEKKIGGLPAHYREIVELYYFENFSYAEIADVLHIPMGTVSIRLSRARDALKKTLTPHINKDI